MNVLAWWTDFLACRDQCDVSDVKSNNSHCASWVPPPFGCIKIKVDGSFKKVKDGIGVVGLDSTGGVMFFAVFPVPIAGSALQVEALAVLKGMEAAGLFRVKNFCGN